MKNLLLLLHRVFNPAPKEFLEQLEKSGFNIDKLVKSGISRRKLEKLNDGSLKDWILEQKKKAEDNGWKILTFFDENYPPLLKEISHPPIIIFVKGNIELPCFAIVGTRRATEYGRSIAFNFARKLSSSGLNIVSGLAHGIDTYAHKGALSVGKTIAVLGSGGLKIYPSSNRLLAKEIAENGALVTEFFPDDGPARFRFPLRNRIIAGLSFGVLVVEAGQKSGAMITARLALEYGRDIFAIPGDIGRRTSLGTNLLIQQGAKLVLDVEDIIGEYYEEKKVVLTKEEEILLSYIPENESVDAEFLTEVTSIRPERIFRLLLELEMKGVIIQTSGWRYRKIG